MEKYGSEYREARKQKMGSMKVLHDEITFRTDNLEIHQLEQKLQAYEASQDKSFKK